VCGTCVPADDSQNTTLAYPAWWTPTGQPSPIKDYFNKYIVTAITQADPTGGSANDTIATTYTPRRPAGLAYYDDNPLTRLEPAAVGPVARLHRMTVSTGTSPDPITKTTYNLSPGAWTATPLPAGRHPQRQPSTESRARPPPSPDSNQFAGMTYETQVFNGAARVSDTISDPWTSAATATHALYRRPAIPAGVPDRHCRL